MTLATTNDVPLECPAVPLVTSASASTTNEVVARVEKTLEEVDALWAMMATDGVDAALRPAARQDVRVSIVIPVYNEKRTVLDVIERVRQLPFGKEIIVVDDCSTDGTRGWLETIRETPGLKLILKQQNEGKGAALRDGFAAATGEIIVVQDADLEYDPREIERVIAPIVAGEADVVYGSRYLQRGGNDRSLVHRLINWSLTDMETCHKAFRAHIVRELPLRQNRFGFEPEVTAKIARRHYRVQETPISYTPRGYAQGKKIGIRDAFNTLYCIVRYGLAD